MKLLQKILSGIQYVAGVAKYAHAISDICQYAIQRFENLDNPLKRVDEKKETE